MGYRYETKVQGKWYSNQVTFETEAEAKLAGDIKFRSWTMCDEVRVVPTKEPVNYRCTDGGELIHIERSQE